MLLDGSRRAKFEAGCIGIHLAQTKSNLSFLADPFAQDGHKGSRTDSFGNAGRRHFSFGAGISCPQMQTTEANNRGASLHENQQSSGSLPYSGPTPYTDKDPSLSAMIASIAEGLHEELRGFLASFSARLAAREAAMAQYCDRADKPSAELEARFAELARRSSNEIENNMSLLRDSISGLTKRLNTQEARMNSFAEAEDWSHQIKENSRVLGQKVNTKLEALEQRIQDCKVAEESRHRTHQETLAQRMEALERRVTRRFKDSEAFAKQIAQTIPDIDHMRELCDSLQSEKMLSDMWQRRISTCETSSQRIIGLETQLVASERQMERSLDEQAQLVRESLHQSATLASRISSAERSLQGFEGHSKTLEQRVLAACEQQQQRIQRHFDCLYEKMEQRLGDIEARYVRDSREPRVSEWNPDTSSHRQQSHHSPHASSHRQRSYLSPQQLQYADVDVIVKTCPEQINPSSSLASASFSKVVRADLPNQSYRYLVADRQNVEPLHSHDQHAEPLTKIWPSVVYQSSSSIPTSPRKTSPVKSYIPSPRQASSSLAYKSSIPMSPRRTSPVKSSSPLPIPASSSVAYESAIPRASASQQSSHSGQKCAPLLRDQASLPERSRELRETLAPKEIPAVSDVRRQPQHETNAPLLASAQAFGLETSAQAQATTLRPSPSISTSSESAALTNGAAARLASTSLNTLSEGAAAHASDQGGHFVIDTELEASRVFSEFDVQLDNDRHGRIEPLVNRPLEDHDCYMSAPSLDGEGDVAVEAVASVTGRHDQLALEQQRRQEKHLHEKESHLNPTSGEIYLKSLKGNRVTSSIFLEPSVEDTIEAGTFDNSEVTLSSCERRGDHMETRQIDDSVNLARDTAPDKECIDTIVNYTNKVSGLSDCTGSDVSLKQSSEKADGKACLDTKRRTGGSKLTNVEDARVMMQESAHSLSNLQASDVAKSVATVRGSMEDSDSDEKSDLETRMPQLDQSKGEGVVSHIVSDSLEDSILSLGCSPTSGYAPESRENLCHHLGSKGNESGELDQSPGEVMQRFPPSALVSDDGEDDEIETMFQNTMPTESRFSPGRSVGEGKQYVFPLVAEDEDEDDIEAMFQKSMLNELKIAPAARNLRDGQRLSVSGSEAEIDAEGVEAILQIPVPDDLRTSSDRLVGDGKEDSGRADDDDGDEDIEVAFQKSIPSEFKLPQGGVSSERRTGSRSHSSREDEDIEATLRKSKVDASTKNAARIGDKEHLCSGQFADADDDDESDLEAMFQESMPQDTKMQHKARERMPWNSEDFLMSRSPVACGMKERVGNEALSDEEEDDDLRVVGQKLEKVSTSLIVGREQPTRPDRSFSQSEGIGDDDDEDDNDSDMLPGL